MYTLWISVSCVVSNLTPNDVSYQYLNHIWNTSKEYADAEIWWEGMFQPESTPLVPSVEIFGHSDLVDDIQCFRIPSVVSDGKKLYAFAEARQGSCEDCGFSRIVMKASHNFGKSWTQMYYLTQSKQRAKNPTSLYDSHESKIVLHYMLGENKSDGSGQCVPGLSNKQAISYDGNIWTIEDITAFLHPYDGVFPGPGNAFYDMDRKRYVIPAHYCTAYRECGRVFTYYSDDHGLTYRTSNTSIPHMDEATVSKWNNTHLVLNMRTNRSNTTCKCRALSFSRDGGDTWSNVVYEPMMKDPICQGSSASFHHFTFFVNPNMYYARSNLTLFYKSLKQTEWQKKRITNEFAFSDYSSLLNVPIFMNDHMYLGVLWSSCTFPFPFRVWCTFDNAWNIRFGWIQLDS